MFRVKLTFRDDSDNQVEKVVYNNAPITENSPLVETFYIECHSSFGTNMSIEDFRIKYKIEITENFCEGCEYGSLGQIAHMDCPHGCLHDRRNCAFCLLN